MPRNFLSYWKPGTLEYQLSAGIPLNHAASNQYGRVVEGDCVWLVTVIEGRLRLIGNILVGQVTDQDGAGRSVGADDLWQADCHIIPADGTTSEIANIDIHDLAPQLRFESAAGNDRLSFTEDGSAKPQQFQTMRILSPVSVDLLADVLKKTVPNETAHAKTRH